MDNGYDTSTLQEKKDYNNRIVAGQYNTTIHDGITYISNVFDMSDLSQSKIAQLAKFAETCNAGNATWPPGFTWKNQAGTDVAMTAQQMIDLHSAIGTFIKDAAINASTHTTNINATVDIPTLDAYDITTGWPLKATDYTLVSAINKVARVLSGNITQQSGTTVIPYDNTTPLSSEGTQIMSQSVTPSSVNSKFMIRASFMCDVTSNGASLTASVFRGTTCIAVGTIQGASKGLLTLFSATAYSLNIRTTDSPATASAITYSIRFGTSAGTWFLNKTNDATFGGVSGQGWSITEVA